MAACFAGVRIGLAVPQAHVRIVVVAEGYLRTVQFLHQAG